MTGKCGDGRGTLENLRLGNSIEIKQALLSQQFNVERFVNENPDTLSRVMAHVNRNHWFGDYFDKQHLSLLYLFVKQLHATIIDK